MTTFAVPESPGVPIRPISGFTRYGVGNDGSVWAFSPKSGWRKVSIYRRTYGARYCVVSLRENDGKGKVTCRYVHRLVLEAFVGPCPAGMEGCHKDGNTANNHQTNLRWGTKASNSFDTVLHGTIRSKVDPAQVQEIRKLVGTGTNYGRAAELFGLTKSQIGRIVRRESWAGV
jgi:hypothetical protein